MFLKKPYLFLLAANFIFAEVQNNQTKIVAEVGHKTGKIVKITYEEVFKNILKMLQSRGVQPSQFVELAQKNPKVFAEIFSATKESMIKDSVLHFIAKEKDYSSNKDFINDLEEAKKNLMIQYEKSRYAKNASFSEAEYQNAYDNLMKEFKNVKQYSGRMIIVKTKSKADSIVKAIEGRNKSKSIEDSFIVFGKEHSIVPFDSNKGAFSMVEMEITKEYGKNVAAAVNSAKIGSVVVEQFGQDSKLSGNYGVFLISKSEDAKKPEMKDIKEALKSRLIIKKINEQITKASKDIGVKRYNKDGLLEEDSAKLVK
ncbi:hypothetical protein FZC35_00520 [Candidatus Cytomitobacter indipagum]|uniref:Peptidyl-prolyl cis-trans isomerase plp n=1 Tax=Candidatus Cytomitobacter indipagum TaxID=2601575 RepID=A0A5C0UDN8_9PROT|nr:hypothetical protein [Candidatus Cytomitobacter indipagum]QEK37869.1 hypothetical protein FZC35_00520 [Candidatus Cytomitobacter indipagum]